MEVQRLGYMVDDYGEEKVMEAMKQAFRSKGNNVNLNYIEAILSNPFSQRRKEKQQHGSSQNARYGRGNEILTKLRDRSAASSTGQPQKKRLNMSALTARIRALSFTGFTKTQSAN